MNKFYVKLRGKRPVSGELALELTLVDGVAEGGARPWVNQLEYFSV